MEFTGICLVTQDVPRLVAFYRKVLKLPHEEGNIFEFIPVDGAMLSIYTAKGMEEMAPGSTKGAGYSSNTLEFNVEDVDAEHERLVAEGVEIVKPPTTQPWGRRSVWFRDPDGNVINFYMDTEK